MRYGHSARAPTLANMSQAFRSLVLGDPEPGERPIIYGISHLRRRAGAGGMSRPRWGAFSAYGVLLLALPKWRGEVLKALRKFVAVG
jgi:hypothetical protein